MPGVSVKISIMDAATPAIKRINREVSQLISGMYKLNAATKNSIDMSPFLEAQKSMAEAVAIQKQMVNDVEGIGNGYKQIKENAEQAEAAQRRYNDSLGKGVNNATAFGDKLTSSLKRYITMAVGALGGKKLIDASDTWVDNSARLGLITDNLQQQNILQQQIYQSAKNARGAYNDTVDVTAKLGLLAGDAFGSNAEVVKFAELMQKSFKLSGASTQERQSAMYQLTQAMANGKLQGDEFRSIMENAPMLANAIAEYTGVSKGELKELSSDGAITADIIKNALFGAADDIESKFSTLPMTFGDTWTNMQSDATMAFAPVYEQMNNMLNSDLVQGVVAEIPNLFEDISSKVQEMLGVIEGAVIVAGPGLEEIARSAGKIATAVFSANGVAGNFVRTISGIVANPATAKSIQNLGGSFITVANALNSVMRVAAPLSPVITNLYIGFSMFKMINPIMSTAARGVANIVNVTTNMVGVLNGATTAQKALNTVMTTNPYLGVASAIFKVIGAMVSLIGTIKAVNKAADLADESNSEYSYENVKRLNEVMSKNNVDRDTAQRLITDYDSYKQSLEDNNEARQTAYDNWFEENKKKVLNAAYSEEGLTTDEVKKRMIEDSSKVLYPELYAIKQSYNTNQNSLYDNWREQNQNAIDLYNQKIAAKNALDGISDDPNDYYEDFDGKFDVGDVDNVNHINDTVDIASEDLRYLRELADQEAINQFTSKLLQPQITINYGEIRETADVDEITRRLTDGLFESLNNSSDLVHI